MKTLCRLANLLAILPLIGLSQLVHPAIRPVTPGASSGPPSTSGVPPVASTGNAGPMAVPVLGFLAGDTPAQLRAIVGVPGSASLTTDISLSGSVTRTFIPPRQMYVLAEAGTPQALTVVPFSGLNPGVPTVVSSAFTGADLVSFSPSGNVAVLYFSGTQRLQIIAGLPAQPLVTSDIVISGPFAPFRTIAISDDASLVVGTTADSVVVVTATGPAQSIYASTDLGGVALIPQTNDAIVCDAGKGSLIRLRGLTGAVTGEVIDSNLSCSANSSIQVTNGSQSIMVADPSAHAVTAIDLASHAVTQIATPHSPNMLTQLRVGDLFLLSADPNTSAWILDAGHAVAKAYFVAQPRRLMIRVPKSSPPQDGQQGSEELSSTVPKPISPAVSAGRQPLKPAATANRGVIPQ